MRAFLTPPVLLLVSIFAAGCERGPTVDPGVAERPLPAAGAAVDDALADAGAWYFRRNCAACHSLGGGDIVGPDLAGVTERRTLPWVERMIVRPDSMLVHDDTARDLLERYQVPMLDRELRPEVVRAILEFLRRADHGPS